MHTLLNLSSEPLAESFVTARRYPRVPLNTPVEVWADGQNALGETRNISLGGLLLQCTCTRKLQAAKEVKVLFNLPTGHTISTPCKVVHLQAERKIGLGFLDLEEHHRSIMAQFIQQLVTYTRRGVRLTKRVHVTLRPVGGAAFLSEMAETIVLSQHGGLLITRAHFNLGDAVYLWYPQGKRGGQARIVHERMNGTGGLSELGFEFTDDRNFWRLEFPQEIHA
ncbi:MAG TPA: PilZ domain-containing protein [Terriglobales bacterium]|nr:PilZ domain-containing protein [Terriglobales bacterium]